MRGRFGLPRAVPLSCTALFAALLALAAAAGPARGAAVPAEVVVRYTPSAGAAERAALRERAGARAVRALHVPRAQVLRVGDVGAALRALRRSPRVELATRNMPRRAYAAPLDPIPDDPSLGDLWGLERIEAPSAWVREVGSPGVVVAVVDTGVAGEHPELADRIWANPGEIAGNGVDDDGNGFADDARGWDFIGSDPEPRDESADGHGTHVAGTIGATGDNGIGIAGVTWRSTIMPVRVLDANGSGDSAGVAEGFEYAARNGARVVNASLGGPGPDALTAAVISDHPDVLFVVAAGNSGSDNDAVPGGEFPCNHTHANLICVTATDRDDELAGFASFGAASVDLGAPGVEVVSTSGWAFGEDFEDSEPLSEWTADAAWGLQTDELGNFVSAEVGETADATLATTDPFALTDRGDCRLGYWAAWELQGTDAVRVERSFDDGPWEMLTTHPGISPGFVERDVALPLEGSAAQVRLRFALSSNGSGSPASFATDDIAVRCEGFDAQAYATFDGTSMATPHVAGAAALLLAADPSAGPLELRTALLDGGDPVPSLAGVTATGRRLNANAALERLALPWAVTGDAVAITQTSARLTGSVDPRGSATAYQFEWGPTPGYGQVAPAGPVDAGAGEAPVAAAADLFGLSPATTYHYRLVALRGGARFPGADRSFRTAAEPAPFVVTPAFGADAKVRCKARRIRLATGRRKRVARCRATAEDAVRVKIVLKRRGRVVAKRRGRTGRYLRLRGSSVRRARYTVVLKLRAADDRRATVRRKRRI